MEHGRVLIWLPNTCILLARRFDNRSTDRNELVRSEIAPFNHTLQLFIGPRIEIHRLDSTDVRAHAPVNARAANADKNTQIPGSPSRIYTDNLQR